MLPNLVVAIHKEVSRVSIVNGKTAALAKLRIAQVAPLWEAVPPPIYGGIELVVSSLTEELVRRGHHVTLFASGDSQTSAHIEVVCPNALRRDPINKYNVDVYELLQLARVAEKAAEFDIIHCHLKCNGFPFASRLPIPTLQTLHYPLELIQSLAQHYPEMSLVSISEAQRQSMPHLNYVGTVYNGINPEDYSFFAQPPHPPYLAFLGRMSKDKGPDQAIAIAKLVGLPLKLAGKVGFEDEEFFQQSIKPEIDGKNIEYLGEITHEKKVDLLGNAAVTLFPITWPEPFGLVMIESMCTGTPVIGMNLGSVPEVIAHGQTGFVCNSFKEMAASIPAALELDRYTCRNYVESHFSVARMVDAYETTYRQVIAAHQSIKMTVDNTPLGLPAPKKRYHRLF